MACPALLPAAGDGPAGLPDLQLEGIMFTVGGAQTRGAPAGTEMVNITVYADDKGLDNLTFVNFTLTVNGTVLGVKPPDQVVGGIWRIMAAYLEWPTGALPPGVYEIGASVNDSAGDRNPADNAASVNFTISSRPPRLSLSLDQSSVEADVSGISPGFATLTGNITAADLFGQILRVTVQSTSDIGWVTVSFPSEVLFVEDRTASFSLILNIPAGSLARVGTVTVEIGARALGLDLNASASANVTARPYYSFELSTKRPIIDIETGGACTFTFQLRNDGTRNDSFALEIANSGDLESKDASVTLSCRTLENVGPGEARTFKVTFRGPQDWTIWKADSTLVLVKASSVGARSEYRIVARSCPVYAQETGMVPPWLSTLTVITIAFGVGSSIFMGIAALLVARKKRNGPNGKGQAGGGVVDGEPKPPGL
jgi:hypothetical protein